MLPARQLSEAVRNDHPRQPRVERGAARLSDCVPFRQLLKLGEIDSAVGRLQVLTQLPGQTVAATAVLVRAPDTSA